MTARAARSRALRDAGVGAAVAQLLPDLTMLQPTDFHLDLPSGGTRLLRFSTRIVNLGPGRFDVVGSDPDPLDPTKLRRVVQRLEQNGGWVTQLTPATMLADVAALTLAYAATMFAGRAPTSRHTFGLARAEVLAAFVNAQLLLVGSGLILFEAWRRFRAPSPVHTSLMPAFGPTHKEEEIWKIVAFLRHLPELSKEEEKALGAGGEHGEHEH